MDQARAQTVAQELTANFNPNPNPNPNHYPYPYPNPNPNPNPNANPNQELAAKGIAAVAHVANITKEDEVKAMVACAVSTYG